MLVGTYLSTSNGLLAPGVQSTLLFTGTRTDGSKATKTFNFQVEGGIRAVGATYLQSVSFGVAEGFKNLVKLEIEVASAAGDLGFIGIDVDRLGYVTQEYK